MAALPNVKGGPKPATIVVRVRTTITLPRELHQRVRILAVQRETTMEAIIEAAIVARLDGETDR